MSSRDRISRWTAITALIAWVLANGLDIFSALLVLQFGGRLAFASHHLVEYFVIYADIRILGTLAFCFLFLFVSKRWPSVSGIAWGTLTACSLVTAILAWWRLYQ